MSQDPHKLNDLLELVGTEDFPGDSVHRHELRRRLLCSSFFDDAECNVRRFSRVFAYVVPLVAGTMTIGMLVVVASVSFVGDSTTPVVEVERSSRMSTIEVNEFVSDPDEPKVQLVDFMSEDQAMLASMNE